MRNLAVVMPRLVVGGLAAFTSPGKNGSHTRGTNLDNRSGQWTIEGDLRGVTHAAYSEDRSTRQRFVALRANQV